MKLGALDISTVKLGTNQVQAVYQGSNLVWQNAPVATAATGVGQTSFTANWNAYTGAVVYLLDVSESSDFSTFVYEDQQVNAPTTSYVVIGLNPNTTYYYRVRASTEALTDADYQAVLDYATTQGYTLPSASQQLLQNQLVVDLKDAGVWSKLDIFYLFATDGDSDFASINWKDPNTFEITEVNSPTFTTNQGFSSDGASSYLNTNFNLSTSGTNYTQDDMGLIFGTSKLASITASRPFGLGVNQNYLSLRTDVQRFWLNSSGYIQMGTFQTIDDQLIFGNRTSATLVNIRKTELATLTTNTATNTINSTTLPSENMYILGSNNTFWNSTNTSSLFALGSNLSTSEMEDVETAYYTNYFTNI